MSGRNLIGRRHPIRLLLPGICLMLMCLILYNCCSSEKPQVEPLQSWRTVLQGIGLHGWTISGPENWEVRRQGYLTGKSSDGTTEGWIFSNAVYSNFHLRFVYTLDEDATAGIAVRTPSGTGSVMDRGYEIVLGKSPDDWYGPGSILGIQPARTKGGELTEGIHSCQISALGDRISVYIDGRKKADLHDRKSLQGAIGFKLPNKGTIVIHDLEVHPLPDSKQPLTPTLKELMDNSPGQFENIMPGKNLEGWKMLWSDDGRWYYDGDVLVGTDVRSNSWLFTEKSYRDFILQLEFKWQEGANGGVIYRYPWPADTGKRPGGPQARAEETQIIFNDIEEPGALHGQMRVRKGIGKPADWNLYEMYCYDDRIAVYINGTKVTDWHNAVSREGAVGIQSLGAGSTMRYRNIEIKEMPSDFVYYCLYK